MRQVAKFFLFVGIPAFIFLNSSIVNAQVCDDAPQVLIVLDQSSSMISCNTSGEVTSTYKWDSAVEAIEELTLAFEDLVEFGLILFPSSAGRCNHGIVNVPVAISNSAAIMAALPDRPPCGGNWTPMSESLYEADRYYTDDLADPTRRRFVALITDGWEWCDGAEVRFAPVEATQQLIDHGIVTYVIGFGSSVDSLTLNRSAVTAGTEILGCDPTSSDPAATDNCYHQADDLEDLSSALREITTIITEEVCDGRDNDCDDEVDEGLSRECATLCGMGTETCDDGSWIDCDAPIPQDEICDGIDNDCDGITDPGCDCENGDTRRCGTDEGECSYGEVTCIDGEWGPCEGAETGGEEICDGLDNDCDGVIDPGCLCDEGDERPCGRDEGACEQGTQRCVDGEWGPCQDAVGPADEICDEEDNDCDGIVDEGCHCVDGENRPCGVDEGECEAGEQECVDGRWTDCNGNTEPEDEICDDLDNDCNGIADDGIDCDPGDLQCEDVVCEDDEMCLDGTCVTIDGSDDPVPDDGNPISGVSNSGCDCMVANSSGSEHVSLVLVAFFGFAIVWLRRRF